MKKHKTLISVLVTVIVLAGLSFLGYTYYSNKNKGGKLIGFGKTGSNPNQADIACASGSASSKIIAGSCTKPKIYPIPSNYKEKCFSSETLGLNEGDLPFPIVTEMNGLGKTWYFNYQSGDRFCYVDKKI